MKQMIRTALVVLVAFAALLPSGGKSATTIIGAAKDNSIFANNVDNSDGGGAGIFSGTNGLGTPCRGLVAFDIGAHIPAGSIITNAELTLYLGMAPNPNSQNIGLHKLIKDWGEGTAGNSNPIIMMSGMGYPASDGDATWSEAKFNSIAWSNAGATGDFEPTASAITEVSGPIDSPFTWTSTASLVNDLQTWLDVPASNFGWALVNSNEIVSRTQKVFYSREATRDSSGLPNSLDLSWRPSLAITYITSSSPPNGDYNHNGLVDAADYVVWRKTLNGLASPAGSGADGNQSGTIDAGDYTYWRARFGNPASGFASGSSVPEPANTMLFLLVAPLAFSQRRR